MLTLANDTYLFYPQSPPINGIQHHSVEDILRSFKQKKCIETNEAKAKKIPKKDTNFDDHEMIRRQPLYWMETSYL